MTEDAKTGSWLKYAAVAVPAIIILGSASGYLSNSGYGNGWFDNLRKPAFMPPGWAFGTAWTILYALMGIAVALILVAPRSSRRTAALTLFFVQLAVNFCWSPIFFGAHQIQAGLAVIVILIVLAAATAWQFWRIRPLAGALLLPYLAWLSFATALNVAIDQLNPGA
jgi:tryptophan-rich sensory protein